MITRLIDYIFTHYEEDISLETLAGVAYYSKDHLPKLFKAAVGATPKQYSLALRLEAAFHHLIIDPQKPVQEIALEGGFSGLSVFSRAMKNRWGYSPEELRRLPHSRQMRLLHGDGQSGASAGDTAYPGARRVTVHPGARRVTPDDQPDPEIQIVRMEKVTGIYLTAPFDDVGKIETAFRSLYGLYRGAGGRAADACGAGPFYGILMPHLRNTYRAFLSSPVGVEPASSAGEIKKGMFASFTVSGDVRATNKAAHYFYRQWLPASGYKIAGIAGFERFDGNPAETSYFELRRTIHIPIAPKL